ncbi:hypothetical protein H8N00_12580, partial [Streptomyces sp. AC563]
GHTWLELTGVHTGPDPGPLEVTLTADLGPDHTTTTVCRLELTTPDTPKITGFTPEKLTIERDTQPVLLWRGPKPGEDGTLPGEYFLQRTDSKQPPAEKKLSVKPDKEGYCRYPVDTKLTETTAFLLRYSVKAGQHQTLEDRAVTFVIVREGDIHAGDLSANGRVTLLATPQECPAPANSETDKNNCVDYDPAPTDGILAVKLRPPSDSPQVTVKVIVDPDSADTHRYVRELSTAAPEVNLQLPIPRAATCRIALLGEPTTATVDVHWFALGSGKLTGKRKQCDQGDL